MLQPGVKAEELIIRAEAFETPSGETSPGDPTETCAPVDRGEGRVR